MNNFSPDDGASPPMQPVIDAKECEQKPSNGSRYNAWKHGLSAKTLVLPNEDAKAFRAKLQAYKDSLETKTPVEDDLAERAAEASWRLSRANLAEKARIMRTQVIERDATAAAERIEALELIERLFADRRGPAETYPARDYIFDKTPRTSWAKTACDDDHPARLLIRLEGTLAGCRLLQARWKSLLDLVDTKQGWMSYHKFRAGRLMGWHPLSAFTEPEVTEMYLACHAIAPQYSNAFQELRSELDEDQFKRLMALLKKRNLEAITPANAKEARAVLRGIAEKALDRLRSLEAERQEVVNILERLQEDILAVEDTKGGAGVCRRRDACNNLLIRNLDALHRCRRNDATGWGKARQERERRRTKRSGGADLDPIATNPADQSLVLDEDDKIRSVYGFKGNVAEGLARYEANVGPQPYVTTNSRPEIDENAIPRVPDFARWVAPVELATQGDRANIQNEIVDTRGAIEAAAELYGPNDSENSERRRIEEQILQAERDFVNNDERVDQVDVATMGLDAQGDRAEIQNEIDDTSWAIEATAELYGPNDSENSERRRLEEQILQADRDFVIDAERVDQVDAATMGLTAQGDRAEIQNEIDDDNRAVEEVAATPEVDQSQAAPAVIEAGRGAIPATTDSPPQIVAESGFDSGANDGVRDGIAAVELAAKRDRTKTENEARKRKWNKAGGGARRKAGPKTKVPSKERQHEIMDKWASTRRLLPTELAELEAHISELEASVRAQRAERKRERAEGKR